MFELSAPQALRCVTRPRDQAAATCVASLILVAEIACPACAESERLRGENRDGSIWITCESCQTTWLRDTDRCEACGERSIADRREPLFQKARGTQQSIIGYRIVKECWSCGWAEDSASTAAT